VFSLAFFGTCAFTQVIQVILILCFLCYLEEESLYRWHSQLSQAHCQKSYQKSTFKQSNRESCWSRVQSDWGCFRFFCGIQPWLLSSPALFSRCSPKLSVCACLSQARARSSYPRTFWARCYQSCWTNISVFLLFESNRYWVSPSCVCADWSKWSSRFRAAPSSPSICKS